MHAAVSMNIRKISILNLLCFINLVIIKCISMSNGLLPVNVLSNKEAGLNDPLHNTILSAKLEDIILYI